MRIITKHSEEKPVKLDLKDKKILYELDFNARISFPQLAKKIGLSRQGAEYKVNNLVKKGLIKGFYAVVNVPKLGYKYSRLLLTLQNLNQEKEKEIINFLQEHKKVFWLIPMQGIYDIMLVMWARNVTEFKEFIDELLTKYGTYIKRKVETITTDVIHYQHRYLLNRIQTKEIHIKETEERISIDKLDKQILNALCLDGRVPLVGLASQLKSTPKIIAYRIKRMEKMKLIESYRPILDHSKIGFTYYKIYINLNNITKEKLLKLKTYIKNNPFVIYLIEGIGLPADLDIEMMVKSNEQLFKFIKDLKHKFPELVGEYQPVIFLDTLKVRYLPF